MCGIVGFWNRGGEPADVAPLGGMMESLAHRGPDDRGTWSSGDLTFGHLRLSIIDLSTRGRQPFTTPDEKGVLTYNGEVYNFRELRARLEGEGIAFRSDTDTEVVLWALHHWGPLESIPLFNGMFAFGYYDARKDCLWLSRDRLGIKPIYYTHVGQTLLFASEIKTLLRHPLVSNRPDLHCLTAQMLHQRLEGEWTPFEGIRSLLPGTMLEVTREGVRRHTYFDAIEQLDADRLLAAGGEPIDSHPQALAQLLRDSVNLHMVSDAPLAAMCSGGIDSSLLTSFARESKSDLVGYVADVKGTISEGAKANLVGRHLDVPIRQVDVDFEDYLRLWTRAIWHNDQPSFHTHDMPFLAVARACQRDGIKVLITGEGSDELYGGYGWQEQVYRMWRLRRLHHRLVPNWRLFRLLGKIVEKLAPLDFELLARDPFAYRSAGPFPGVPFNQNSIGHWLQLRTICGDQRAFRHQELFEKLAPIEPIEDRAFLARCIEDLYGYLQSLLQRNDRMGMAASIESRFPFLENEVVQHALHLPREAKWQRGVGKQIIRQVAADRLPAATLSAAKVGFAVSDRAWENAAPLLDDGITAELFKWSAKTQGQLIPEIAAERRLLYVVVSFEIWGRLFLRGETIENLTEQIVALCSEAAKN